MRFIDSNKLYITEAPTGTRLHLPCGDVYLKGYVNADIEGIDVKQLTENPNETTIDKYFKYEFGTARRPIIYDLQMDALKPWPFENGSVAEIVSLSFVEHFTQGDLGAILNEVERVLIPGGNWIVDFPDILNTVKKYYYSDEDFCNRLIYCNQKNEYSVHRRFYTEKSFRKLLMEREGWAKVIRKTYIEHDYPTISILAKRKIIR